VAERRLAMAERMDVLLSQLNNSLPKQEKRAKLTEITGIIEDKVLRKDSIAPSVRPYLKDADPDVRGDALGILSLLADKGAVLEIEKMTTADPNVDTRRTAITALAMCSKTSAIPHLKKLLQDSDIRIRLRSAAALGY